MRTLRTYLLLSIIFLSILDMSYFVAFGVGHYSSASYLRDLSKTGTVDIKSASSSMRSYLSDSRKHRTLGDSVTGNIRRTRVLEGVRIFIDPGHGGSDTGAVNSDLGITEKEINLAIALKLGELLERYGADVLYSRTSDIYVSLSDRVAWANANDSDVFISIHCNSATDTSARGFEVYYHGVEDETANDLNGYELARVVHDGVVREVSWRGFSIYDRGVKADTTVYSTGFYVLRNTNMSAILIETLFISNDDDAKLLMDEDFQWAVAYGVLRGLYRYVSVGKKLYGNDVGVDSDYPSAWLLSNGSIAYAWHTNRTGDYRIMFTLTDIQGNILNSAIITDTTAYHPATVETPDGKIFVFYNKPAGTYHNIYYKVYSSAWSSEYLLSSDPNGHTSFPHAIMATDRLIVFFHSNRDGDWDIYMKYSDDYGLNWSDDIKIFDTTVNERAPRAFFDGKRIWLVYKAVRGSYYQVCLRYSDDLGETWSDEIQLTYSSANHDEPSVVGVYTYEGLRIIVFYVYDLGYTTNIYALYTDDYGYSWKWAPIAFSPSLDYAPFALKLSNTSFRLIYSQMILRTVLNSSAKYKAADIYYLDIIYEKPKFDKVLMEWHYESSNDIILNNYSDIIDYTMPVTYTIKYYGGDAELLGWYNRTFEALTSNKTNYVPLIQDLFTTQIPDYLSGESSRELIARSILRVAIDEGALGVAIDIETSISSSYEKNMSDLFRRIHNYLSAFGLLTIAIVPPKESDISGWLAYNYTEIAKYSDYFVIMAYEYHGSWSDPGPISPTGRVERIVKYALSKVENATRIVMAYPTYGHDWYYDPSSQNWIYYRAVFYDDVQSIKANYDYNETFVFNFTEDGVTYEANEYSLEYQGNYHHKVFFVDTESILYRMGLASYYGINKFSFWRFCHDMDKKLLELLYRWKSEGLQNRISTNVTNPLELFGSKEVVISISVETRYVFNMTLKHNGTKILSIVARNGTSVNIDTTNLTGEVILLEVNLANRFEALTENITIYKLNFSLLEAPSTITRSLILAINHTLGFKRFYIYVSEDNETWSLVDIVNDTFELNVTQYTNTTIYLQIVGETVNGRTYPRFYGPIQVINYFYIEVNFQEDVFGNVLELYEKDTIILVSINTTMLTNLTITMNNSKENYVVLGGKNIVIDTSCMGWGLTILNITAIKGDFVFSRIYRIYKLFMNLEDLPKSVLNYSIIRVPINNSGYFLYFQVYYSYDNASWELIYNATEPIFTLNFSIFSKDISILLVGVTRYNNYKESYGPIHIMTPLSIELSPMVSGYIELFEEDTTITVTIEANTTIILEVTIDNSILLNTSIAPNNKTEISIDTHILSFGIHILDLKFRTTDSKFSREKKLEIRKLFFDLLVPTSVFREETQLRIEHSAGFLYFLVYIVDDKEELIANTTNSFTVDPSVIGNKTFSIRIHGITQNSSYVKVFGPYQSLVQQKQEVSSQKMGMIPFLAIIIVLFVVSISTIYKYWSLRKRIISYEQS